MKTTTISIAIEKGGQAKSTTAQALASTLGTKGYKVLLVDMDSQANVTYSSGVEAEKTITDIFAEECSTEEAIYKCSLYDLIGADKYLSNMEQMDSEDPEYSTTLLKDTLAAVDGKYDYIIIDTPPLLGNILKQCLMASDYIIIPTEARPYSLQAIDVLNDTIEGVKELNKSLEILGILLVRYHDRTVLNRQIRDEFLYKSGELHTRLFNTMIREGIAVPEAQTMQESLIEYAPKSNPCIDYMDFTEEVLKRLKKGVK